MKYTATHHLQAQIEQLENERRKLETVIVRDVQKISDTIKHPAPYIRATVAELASDRTFFTDLVSIIIQFATSYFSNKFGKSASKFSFLNDLLGGMDGKQGEGGSSILDLLKKLFKGKSGHGDDTGKGE